MAKKTDLETRLSDWYKGVPHLPKDAVRWLSNNIWWMALIGVIVSALGLLVVIPALIKALSLAPHFAGFVDLDQYRTLSTGSWLSLSVTLGQYMATIILLAFAVPFLREKTYTGWKLLYWSFLLNLALNVISSALVLNLYNVVMAFISAVVAGYFLFEIRDHFSAKRVKRKKK